MSAVVPRIRTEPAPGRVRGPSPVLRPVTVLPAERRPSTAADVMTRFPPTAHQGDSLWTAWDRLARAPGSHLVVVDDDRRPVGVLDDRAIALEWPAGPVAARRTPVHALLAGRPRPRVRSGQDLATVARVMLGARADALPVVDRDGRLFGLVTLWHFAELAARDEGGEPADPRPGR